MKRIDFFQLTRAVEERFLESTRGQAAPLPLLVGSPPPPFDAIRWGGLAVLAFVAWIWVASLGYGKLESPLALQPTWMAGAHALLLALSVAFALRARACLAERTKLPFRQATYLFPIGVIDARTASLAIYDWSELTSLDVQGKSATFRFASGSYTFPLANAEQGNELKRRVEELRQKLTAHDVSERDLVLLDPLRDTGFKSPFAPVESMRPPGSGKIPVLLIAGLLGAVALGIGAWAARNALSERSLFAKASAIDSVEAYKDYLARGGKREEVTELRLPRAELRAAFSAHSVDAMDRYIAAHPSSKIGKEVQDSLRYALLQELEAAKAKGTITALREFEKRREKHLEMVPELAQAKHQNLQGALDAFRTKSKAGMPLLDLARCLIIYCDKNGPVVTIRYRQRESRSLDKNQRMLMESAYFGGQKTLPTQYLTGEAVRRAEGQAGKELAAELSQAFPPDLVRFEVGPPVPDGPDDKVDFKAPTLLVNYRLEISGAFVTKKPRAVFAGVGFIANSVLSIPDKGEAYELKDSAWHSPELRRIEAGEIEVENVYGEVVTKGFKRFGAKYAAPWLGKEP
ncbi:MAG TPA: hypothetical protein VF103_08665 [Polyangiaceae bacterium]